MYEKIKQEIIRIATIIWDKRLSDNAGGNISVREGNVVCITPKYMGYRYHYRIDAENLIVTNLEGDALEGRNEISREKLLHLGLYREFQDAGAVIHAHPYWTNVFVSRARSIIPTLEYTMKYGHVECIEETPACSEALANRVIDHFKSKRNQWEKTALEVIVPRHGVVAMGKDLNDCFDILDRMESECRCQILGRMLAHDTDC